MIRIGRPICAKLVGFITPSNDCDNRVAAVDVPFVNALLVLHRLQFHNHSPLNDQVGADSFVKLLTLILDRNRNLTPDKKPSLLQFLSQRHLADRFKQPWGKVLMQMDGTIHDYGADRVFIHLRVSVTP